MTPYVTDSDFVLYVGDVRDCLRELPAASVHTVVTSPPYWGLRDYGTEGQIGLEPTPEAFVTAMVDVFREVRRVLRDDGTCWVNLGDSYAGAPVGSFNGGGFKDKSAATGGRDLSGHETSGKFDKLAASGLKQKDLCGIPWRVAFALQADGWILRSDIIWAKPNPMPESVTDRPTKAHEYVFLLSKSPRYFFDQEAVREPVLASNWHPTGTPKFGKRPSGTIPPGIKNPGLYTSNPADRIHPESGRNVRSVWEIATQPYPDAHFATFPEALPERCIKAGSSERGCCPECGAPWARQVESRTIERADLPHDDPRRRPRRYDDGKNGDGVYAGTGQRYHESTTTGWAPSCDCNHPPVPCTVLDPFMGSGTTALVARRLGRKSIGVELNPEYAALCARRLQQLSLLA